MFLWFLIINYLTNYPIRTFRKKTSRLFHTELYKRYLSKHLKADNNKIESLWTGQSNSIIQKWCDNWRTIINENLLRSIVKVIITIITIIFVIINNLWIKVLIIVAIVLTLMMTIARFWNKRLSNIRKNRRDLYIQTDRSIIRLIMSKFEVLQNNKITKEINTIGDFFSKIIHRDKKESTGFIFASDLPRALIDFMKFWLIFRYWLQIFKWWTGFAEFTLVWMLMNQVSWVLFEANDSILMYYDQIIHVEKLRKTFDDIPPIKGYETGNTFKFEQGNIEFQNMSFNYGEKNIFEDFSLKIIWWQKIALVGESWSGKTTLIKLISGYIHPTEGKVIIDNQDLQKTALKSYYNNIGYLTQEPNVFDGTVLENLLYGTKRKVSKKEIQTAIKLSKCDFISQFKDWTETQIWEKGVRLSGGQKQRLAIAKLFLKNPHIVFLDEPTSALDSFSEEQITGAFDNLFQWRTVIVAAHRLQTVKKADIIYVFDWGKIVESGTHTELLKKKWKYYKMIELQSGF